MAVTPRTRQSSPNPLVSFSSPTRSHMIMGAKEIIVAAMKRKREEMKSYKASYIKVSSDNVKIYSGLVFTNATSTACLYTNDTNSTLNVRNYVTHSQNIGLPYLHPNNPYKPLHTAIDTKSLQSGVKRTTAPLMLTHILFTRSADTFGMRGIKPDIARPMVLHMPTK